MTRLRGMMTHIRWRDARGTSTVELALVCPILMVMLAGLVDCARLMSAP